MRIKLIVGSKCQSSILPDPACKDPEEELDCGHAGRDQQSVLLPENTQALTTLFSAKQKLYLAAAFPNVNQLLCLSYLFHHCEKSSMPLDASVTRAPPAGATLRSPFHVSFQIMKISSAWPV